MDTRTSSSTKLSQIPIHCRDAVPGATAPSASMPATFRSALSSLRFLPRGRRAHPPWPRSSDRGAPYFIYPAQRHRASARAKALYGALIDATFRSALSSLRFPPRPPQCQHPQQLFLFSKVFPLRFSVFLCLNIVAKESAFYTFIINENRRYSWN